MYWLTIVLNYYAIYQIKSSNLKTFENYRCRVVDVNDGQHCQLKCDNRYYILTVGLFRLHMYNNVTAY